MLSNYIMYNIRQAHFTQHGFENPEKRKCLYRKVVISTNNIAPPRRCLNKHDKYHEKLESF